jgi:hypothetical protein
MILVPVSVPSRRDAVTTDDLMAVHVDAVGPRPLPSHRPEPERRFVIPWPYLAFQIGKSSEAVEVQMLLGKVVHEGRIKMLPNAAPALEWLPCGSLVGRKIPLPRIETRFIACPDKSTTEKTDFFGELFGQALRRNRFGATIYMEQGDHALALVLNCKMPAWLTPGGHCSREFPF